MQWEFWFIAAKTQVIFYSADFTTDCLPRPVWKQLQGSEEESISFSDAIHQHFAAVTVKETSSSFFFYYFFFIDNTERKPPIYPLKEQGVTAAAKVISDLRLLCCKMLWDIQDSITLRRSGEHWQVFFSRCNRHVHRLMRPDDNVWCTVNR